MGKPPADQWYFSDWLRDVELQMASSSTRGIWMNMLCHMWFAKVRGELSGLIEKVAQICNATAEEFTVFCEEAESLDFCYFSVTDNGNVTLSNRRMSRDEKSKKQSRLRQKRFRDKRDSNGKITPPSSSSSSSSKICRACKKQFKPLYEDHELCRECFIKSPDSHEGRVQSKGHHVPPCTKCEFQYAVGYEGMLDGVCLDCRQENTPTKP